MPRLHCRNCSSRKLLPVWQFLAPAIEMRNADAMSHDLVVSSLLDVSVIGSTTGLPQCVREQHQGVDRHVLPSNDPHPSEL